MSDFIPLLWRNVDPSPFVSGWHIDAICEHLEAVLSGDIKRLIINIPPRHMKSLSVSVFFPMWAWLHNPEIRFLYASYAQDLSTRDSVKSRRIFQSPRYQSILRQKEDTFERPLVLVGDQNTKKRFDNNYNGYRIATSTDGMATGEGGDIIVVDDPHNVKHAESDTKRLATIAWWDETMSTRLNDDTTGAIIIIMQRIHESDLVGHILKREASDWNHLCLPARYEEEERTRTIIDFVDPRTEEGELLWPEKQPEEAVKKRERSLGPYGTAGQLQQRPSPRKGAMIPVESLRYITHEAWQVKKQNIVRSVRYWDKAGTEGGGARTASALGHVMKNGSTVYSDITKGQWGSGKRESIIKEVSTKDASDFSESRGVALNGIAIWVEQEPGSGGKESAENTLINLAAFDVHKDPVGASDGNKTARAQPLAAGVENGLVFFVLPPVEYSFDPDSPPHWIDDATDEMRKFPRSTFKDQVDALAGCYNKLHPIEDEESVGTWGIKAII